VEINRNCEYTIVPGSPASIKGILNLRGQLIVAFDMGILLDVETDPKQRNSVSILIKAESSIISLMVDRVGDILPLKESAFEVPPNNFSRHAPNAVLGAYKLSDNLLIVVDPNLLISQAIANSTEISYQ
jgi:purine-binding chemotaxis protein CheW